MILRKPDSVRIDGKYPSGSSKAELEFSNDSLDVYITADEKLSFATLRWNFRPEETRKEPVRIMGDAWERSYGELSFRGIEPDRIMPWYFAVSNGSDSNPDYTGRLTECFGVSVRPSAMCCWQYDTCGISLNLDLRNGGQPVELGGRKLHACTVLMKEYRDMSAFEALCGFCRIMSPEMLKYDKKIYGSNNWYYAYGRSSREEILADTELVASLCSENRNPPFMVIDDGWQIYNCDAPWLPRESFGDMESLAAEMKESGVIPGIWVRYLVDGRKVLDLPEEAYRNGNCLDPTHPRVKEYVAEITKRLTGWGYKLIKHDFSTFDLTGRWGKEIGREFGGCKCGFYDRSKTTAEIIKDFYQLILDNAGDAAILGCNTVSHLCAGLVHANRIGDDTSGRSWEPTRHNGINTLAFRLCQNNSFYIADADCVGIMGPVDWSLNRQWLELLAYSGSPLFVSCKPSEANENVFSDLKEGFAVGSEQAYTAVPVDWMETNIPAEYIIDDRKVKFDWYTDK